MKYPYQILFAVLGALPLFCVAADAVQTPVASTNQVAAAPAVVAPVAKAEALPEAKASATNAVAKAPEAKASVTNAVAETSAKASVKKTAVKADAKDEADDEAAASSGTNSVPSAAEKPEDPRFARYKTILDRMPFGPEPVGFDPDSGGSGARGGIGANGEMTPEAAAAAAQAEAEQMLQGVRISALNVTPRGSIAVGFTDSSKQPAATYYMKVGETRDGWTIKSADPHEMTVTLERDGVEGTLKLGEGADPNAKGAKGGGRPGQPNAMANRGMMGLRGGMPNGGGFGGRPSWGAGRGGFGGMRGGMPMTGVNAGGASASNETAGDALARLRQRRLQKEAERQAESARQAAAAEQAKAEREKAAAEREKAAAEREQQRQTLLQIQEELRRQREVREQQQQQQQQNETGAGAASAPAATPPEA